MLLKKHPVDKLQKTGILDVYVQCFTEHNSTDENLKQCWTSSSLPCVSPRRPPASSVAPPVKAPSSGPAVSESGVSLETPQSDSSRWPQMPDQKLAYSATSPPCLWTNDDEDGFVMHKNSGSKAFNHWLLKLLPSNWPKVLGCGWEYKQEQRERQHRHLSQLLRVRCKRKRDVLFEYSKHGNKSGMRMHAGN